MGRKALPSVAGTGQETVLSMSFGMARKLESAYCPVTSIKRQLEKKIKQEKG